MMPLGDPAADDQHRSYGTRETFLRNVEAPEVKSGGVRTALDWRLLVVAGSFEH
jgi:hypothetical protein